VAGASPTVRRRELGARLRELRTNAGLSVEDVAAQLEVSPAKVSRIETGARGVNINDIRVLCDVYEVTAPERERLLMLARESRRRSWWQEYGIPEVVRTYVGLEDSATSILQYETSLLPPLLQTESYARALTAGILPWASDEEVEQLVLARIARQALLTSERPPELWAIVDEAALHRVVGDPAVMREQLTALAERSRAKNVTLQVLGLEAGAHPGMDSAFTMLKLAEVSDVVYVEGLIGNFYLQSSNDLTRYGRTFDHLQAAALSPKHSRDRITAVAAALP
jgi:transcriptional regulator with XRE-family HTH domain